MRLAALIVTVLAALAAVPAAAGYRFEALRRGPLVVVRADDAVPAVAVTAIVGAGAVDEGPGMIGASHFLEHLCFNGTERRSQEELYRETDRLGLYSNAFTRREFTAYQLLGPSDRLAEMFDLQADMLFGSTLPPEKFEKERGIVLEEIAKDAARSAGGPSPGESFERQVLGAHPATGTPESIGALRREDVLAYHRERYRPGNTVLYVTGAVDPDEVLGLARRHYRARGRRAEAVAREPLRFDFAPAGSAPRRIELSDGAARQSWLLFPAPAPGEAAIVEAQVLARALSEAARSALGPAASARLEVTARSPLLVLSARLPAGELERRLQGELLPSLGAEDLARAASALGAEEVLQAEQPHYHAFFRAPLLLAGDVAALERMAELPGSLDAAAALDWSRALLSGPRLAVEGGGTDEEELPPPPGGAASGAPQTRAAQTQAAGAAAPASGLDRVRRGTRTLAREVLPGGLVLLTESSPEAGVFAAAVVFRDKAGHERRHCLPGAAEVLHRSFREGTQLRSADELEADLAEIGAELKTVDIASLPYDDYALSPEYGYLRAKAPAGGGDALLRLLGELVSWPRFDDEAVERSRQGAVTAVGLGRRGGREAAGQAFRRDVLGQDPWPPRGTTAGLQEVQAENLEAFATDYLAPSNTIVAVVTNRPHEEIAERVRREWRAAGRGWSAARPLDGPGEGGCDPRFDEPPAESAQVWMLLGQRLAPAGGRRAAALRSGNAWLSDRVAFVVREELGLAYSVGTALDPEEGWFRVSLGTRPENVEAAAEAARRAAREALATGIDPADWDAAVHAGRGRRLMRRLPSDNRAFQAAVAELAEGAAAWTRPDRDEAAAGADEALAALREVLDPGAWSLAVGR